MSDPQYVPSYPPQASGAQPAPRGPQRSGSWTPILIFTCLALGFAASAVEYERTRAVGERNRANVMAADDSVSQGRMEDLGKFLSDSRTRWIHLSNPDDVGGMRGVIAWNPESQSGYFFCDRLPVLDAGSRYELWALPGTGDPESVATISPQAGMSVYPFHFLSGSVVAGNRLEITAGPRTESKGAILSGEID
jgi:hypothetical protein